MIDLALLWLWFLDDATIFKISNKTKYVPSYTNKWTNFIRISWDRHRRNFLFIDIFAFQIYLWIMISELPSTTSLAFGV